MMLATGAAWSQTPVDLSGTWGFTHANDQFQGWVSIHQSGQIFRGTWHTSKGKVEPDDVVTGRIDGDTVTLWRFIGEFRQSFVLTLSQDGNRLDGFGDGYFLNHTNLNMLRSRPSAAPASAAAPARKDSRAGKTVADVSGLWTFTHADGRFEGTVLLHQDGVEFTGTWHTSKGKVEPDDEVSGRIDGNTVTLWRFIGDAHQHFTLTLSPDRSRLDGYGDGFFLDHTNLNMQRMTDPASATPSK